MNTDKEKKDTGRKGEEAVCNFLMEKGHTILERNWRTGHLEVDIISYDKSGIHFVEVKTRRPPLEAEPEESVNMTKRRRIIAAATRYMAMQKDAELSDCECLFDIAAVVIGGERITITYYPEAYYPFKMMSF